MQITLGREDCTLRVPVCFDYGIKNVTDIQQSVIAAGAVSQHNQHLFFKITAAVQDAS